MSAEAGAKVLTQRAPWPEDLQRIVDGLVYRRGWHFELDMLDRGQGSVGLTLVITVKCEDSYNPERLRTVLHYFIVPAASYDYECWRHWLLARVRDVETHEMCEFFVIDGERPYAPNHGNGRDPYTIFTYADVGEKARRPEGD